MLQPHSLQDSRTAPHSVLIRTDDADNEDADRLETGLLRKNSHMGELKCADPKIYIRKRVPL